jgi:hypothetical protein
MDKSFISMSHSEILATCETVLSSVGEDVPIDGWEKPYINEHKDLVIPVTAHPDYHWWKRDSLPIMQILKNIGADYEIAKMYDVFMTEEEWANGTWKDKRDD